MTSKRDNECYCLSHVPCKTFGNSSRELDKNNLFVYLARMNHVCDTGDEEIVNILAEYIDDDASSFMKPLKSYNSCTAIHLMFKHGNIGLLNLAADNISKCPKDQQGMQPVQYIAKMPYQNKKQRAYLKGFLMKYLAIADQWSLDQDILMEEISKHPNYLFLLKQMVDPHRKLETDVDKKMSLKTAAKHVMEDQMNDKFTIGGKFMHIHEVASHGINLNWLRRVDFLYIILAGL